jgi:hypothetical protein
MIKSLADALYPVTNQEQAGLDGMPRKMSDDAYKNRLLQYVSEKVGKHERFDPARGLYGPREATRRPRFNG